MASEIDKFTQILRDNTVSVTGARLAIFKTLLASHRPLKNGEVAALTPSVNRASVYRALDLFEQLGITATLVRGWTPFVELADPFKPHHHHLLCEKCDAITAITSDEMERLIHQIAENYSFTPTSHHFEIKGICRDCRSKTIGR